MMLMSDYEIRRSYTEAKYPTIQIQILAELNATSPENIQRIINGERPKTAKNGRAYDAKWWFTPEDAEIIIDLWNQGRSVEYIADVVGRSKPSIQNFVNKNRDKCPRRVTFMIAEQRAKVLRLYAEGMRACDIAREMGCSDTLVHNIVKKEKHHERKTSQKL